MRILLTVKVRGRYWDGGAEIEVPELLYKAFEPLKTTDESSMAVLTGETVCAEQIQEVMRVREDAAEKLSKALTDLLLEQMSRHDTHNGYKRNEG